MRLFEKLQKATSKPTVGVTGHSIGIARSHPDSNNNE
jgi:hypothetical protein